MRAGSTIYLDHHSTTPVASEVLAEMLPHFSERFGNPHSTDHAFGWQSSQEVKRAATRVADLINADANEIVFTSGATEANNLALLGIARRAAKGARRRILFSAIEHKSVIACCRAIESQLGLVVEQLPVDSEGRITSDHLQKVLAEDVLAVSIMAVNNEIGTIQDIEQLAIQCRNVGAFFHCDAAQAPEAIDLGNLGSIVDSMSLSAHKMYGPKGVGALYLRREHHGAIEPLIYGGGQQLRLRSGTVPVALCVGMGAAAALLQSPDAQALRLATAQRRDRFVKALESLPTPIAMNGPRRTHRHPGNANVQFKGFDASDLLGALQPRLAASTGSACTTGSPEPSHVLRAIGLSDKEAETSIRFSLGRFTSDADVEEAVELIANTLQRLGSRT
jgi:cysteine desulfurase